MDKLSLPVPNGQGEKQILQLVVMGYQHRVLLDLNCQIN